MRVRTNKYNERSITFEWLEKETANHLEPYFVIEGYYRHYNSEEDKDLPNLEDILNFMHQKGFQLISVNPISNSLCKELIFMQF